MYEDKTLTLLATLEPYDTALLKSALTNQKYLVGDKIKEAMSVSTVFDDRIQLVKAYLDQISRINQLLEVLN